MENIFKSELDCFRKKCDEYFESGKLKKLFKTLCPSETADKYYEVFSKHCAGGKRLRAYLVKVGYELSGKTADDRIVLPALSYEVLQTGVLAHDDVIDQSPTRRFAPSMYMELGADHNGISRAICQGDFGIVSAFELVGASEFDAEAKIRAVRHQVKVFFSTIAGEITDIDLSLQDKASADSILEMYALKTAQYTISGPLVLGAILSGVGDCSKLEEFGRNAGIAFQIQDDILGVYADEKDVGKSVTSDLCEGKKTVLTAHFSENAENSQLLRFNKIYGNSASGINELYELRELFDAVGSLEYAKELCAQYAKNAGNVLKELNISAYSKGILGGLLEYLKVRDK